jgi:hypothetical protein
MQMKQFNLNTALLLAVIGLLIWNGCKDSTIAPPETQTIVNNIYDSTKVKSQTFHTQHTNTFRVDSIIVLPPKSQPIDSLAVVLAYYTKVYSRQEYRDTNLALTIEDTIYKNGIFSRGFTYNILRPTQTITTIINPPVKQKLTISAGVLLGTDLKQVKTVSPYIAARYRKAGALIGVDPIKRMFVIGADWRLR